MVLWYIVLLSNTDYSKCWYKDLKCYCGHISQSEKSVICLLDYKLSVLTLENRHIHEIFISVGRFVLGNLPLFIEIKQKNLCPEWLLLLNTVGNASICWPSFANAVKRPKF